MRSTFSVILLSVLSLGISLIVSTPSPAFAAAPSAKREDNETFASVLEKIKTDRKRSGRPSQFESEFALPTALDARVPLVNVLNSLTLQSMPEWKSKDDLSTVFKRIRDERFLSDLSHANFPRRLSWLYPDNGCFARAELALHLLQSWGYPKPAKIFAFGNLVIDTPYSVKGYVKWWYHVVIGYRVGGEILVIDPAVDALRPLPLKDWANEMGAEDNVVEISICDGAAYEPSSLCQKDQPPHVEMTRETQTDFLISEWDRMEELGHDPRRMLGDEPPWLADRKPATANSAGDSAANSTNSPDKAN